MFILKRGVKDIQPVSFVDKIKDLADCDIIIEAISEDLFEKEIVIKQISGLENDDMIIISNTSCISICKLASYFRKPSNIRSTFYESCKYD